MIRFETSRFGSLEVNEEKIIYFEEGIPGFPDAKRYILIEYKDTHLKWLQAVDDPDVAFIVSEPWVFEPEYSIRLDDYICQSLKVKNESDLVILLIIRVENGNVKPNLQGPLLINADTMLGMQVVLDKPIRQDIS